MADLIGSAASHAIARGFARFATDGRHPVGSGVADLVGVAASPGPTALATRFASLTATVGTWLGKRVGAAHGRIAIFAGEARQTGPAASLVVTARCVVSTATIAAESVPRAAEWRLRPIFNAGAVRAADLAAAAFLALETASSVATGTRLFATVPPTPLLVPLALVLLLVFPLLVFPLLFPAASVGPAQQRTDSRERGGQHLATRA